MKTVNEQIYDQNTRFCVYIVGFIYMDVLLYTYVIYIYVLIYNIYYICYIIYNI